jgi:hypothetical protein
MTTKFKNMCINTFAKVKPGSTILSINKYRNRFDEVSNFSICFNINYLNAVKKSQAFIQAFRPKTYFESQARDEMLFSFDKTLEGYNPSYTNEDTYSQVLDSNNNILRGVRLHKKQDIIHIHGQRINKKIIVEGLYPKVNSSEKTLAKKALRAQTPLGKWVQFKLAPGKFNSLSIQKIRIFG